MYNSSGEDQIRSTGGSIDGQVQNEPNGSGGKPSCYPAPPVEIKLFIGRVPQSYEDKDLRPIFEDFGEVKDVVIIKDRETGKHKASAFVKMGSICGADAAIRALNNSRILDQNLGPLQVKYATGEPEKVGLHPTAASEAGLDQAKLFIGSIPKTWGEEQIRELFGQYGQVDETFVMKDNANNTGKGCAFVKYAYKEQALHAIRSLDQKRTLEGCTRPLEVRFAENKSSKNQQSTPPNIKSAVMGLPQPFNRPSAVPPPNNAVPRTIGPWREYFDSNGRAYYFNMQTNHTQWEKPAEFEKSVSGPLGANVFVFHLPNNWCTQDLICAFSCYGNILSCKIAQDKSSGSQDKNNRNRGYGFISYDNIESALAAVNNMNGFRTQEKKLKVSIKKGEESYVSSFLAKRSANNSQLPPPHTGDPGMPSGMPQLCPPNAHAMSGGPSPIHPVAGYGGMPQHPGQPQWGASGYDPVLNYNAPIPRFL